MKAHQNYLSPVDILWCKVNFVFLQNAKKKENSQFWIGCTSEYEITNSTQSNKDLQK